VLIDRDLWSHIDADDPLSTPPRDSASPAEKAHWKRVDDKARTQINLTLSKPELIHVRQAKTAKEAWEKLRQVHLHKGLATETYLRNKLYKYRMKEGARIQDHINGLQEIVIKLIGIGEEVSEHDQVGVLIRSLPDDWASLIQAMQTLPRDQLDMTYVCGRLLSEEQRRDDIHSEELDRKSESAYFTSHWVRTEEVANQLDVTATSVASQDTPRKRVGLHIQSNDRSTADVSPIAARERERMTSERNGLRLVEESAQPRSACPLLLRRRLHPHSDLTLIAALWSGL
jgi:gag-polypeptide of LTR copia-type